MGLANFYNKDDILDTAYKDVPSVTNPKKILPQVKSEEKGKVLELPAFHAQVKTLDQVVDVDYYIPGCPPPPALVKNALMAILEGKLPPKGTVLAEKKALCDSCSLKESKPEKMQITEFKRLYEIEWDPEKCFLAQGIICLGPATRDGCDERCIKANFPCRGCFGPTDEVNDQGAKFLSALASIIETDDEEEMKKIVASIPDMAGLFYRYSLAASILNKRMS